MLVAEHLIVVIAVAVDETRVSKPAGCRRIIDVPLADRPREVSGVRKQAGH